MRVTILVTCAQVDVEHDDGNHQSWRGSIVRLLLQLFILPDPELYIGD